MGQPSTETGRHITERPAVATEVDGAAGLLSPPAAGATGSASAVVAPANEPPVLPIASRRGNSQWAVLLSAGLIALATLAAYANSFQGVMIGDDQTSIIDNPTIRHLWPIWKPLSPPRNGETVSGRPLLNLTFAINYALGGTNVWGYHAVNLAIHILAALTLFGILRRTLMRGDGGRWTVDGRGPTEHGEWSAGEAVSHAPSTVHRPPSTVHRTSSTLLALTIALLWALHPLQTESVTYIVQRAESLCGLFYLLTLYCVIRGAESRSARPIPFHPSSFILHPFQKSLWYSAAILACIIGMATKEVMVTAPLVVLLYDRTFLAGSFGQALRRRWGLYFGLAATWMLLAYLVLSTGLLGKSAGYGAPDAVGAWDYLRCQPAVLLHYLRLAVVPGPLCLDYGTKSFLRQSAIEGAASAIAVGLLLGGVAWGVVRRDRSSLLGVWFFLVLAPSSLVPLRDVAFEHRMYLPLAAVVAAIVPAGYRICQTLGQRFRGDAVESVLAAAVALGLLTATCQRNMDYRSGLAIWQDVADKLPDNPRAYFSMGEILAGQGLVCEAIAQYRKALQINSGYAEAHNNLGAILCQQGRTAEGIAHFDTAIKIQPNYVSAHYNLGNAMAQQGDWGSAIDQFRSALDNNPKCAEVYNNLASVLFFSGKPDESIAHYHQALELEPDNADAHGNLAKVLYQQGKILEALAHWREVIRLQPAAVATLNLVAWTLATAHDASARDGKEAVVLAERAAELTGRRDSGVLDTLAAAYAEAGRFPEAVKTAERALALAEGQRIPALAEKIAARIELYQARTPYRDAR